MIFCFSFLNCHWFLQHVHGGWKCRYSVLVEKVFEKRHVTEESVTLKYIKGSDTAECFIALQAFSFFMQKSFCKWNLYLKCNVCLHTLHRMYHDIFTIRTPYLHLGSTVFVICILIACTFKFIPKVKNCFTAFTFQSRCILIMNWISKM